VVGLHDVLSSDCAETRALDGYVRVGPSAYFDDLKRDCLSLSVAVKPENQIAGLYGKIFDVLNDNIHLFSRSFDDFNITGENFPVVVLSP
jgi:hypothetical protein